MHGAPNIDALVARARLNVLDPYDALVLRRLTVPPPKRPSINTELERDPEDQKRWEAEQATQRERREALKRQRYQAAFNTSATGSAHWFRSGSGTSNW